jgi:mono/diheme cytochrome c family protein
MSRVIHSGCAAAMVLFALGCEQIFPDITWDRMIDQRRGKAYAASSFFADGKLMQAPPEGSVPADRTLGPSTLTEGRSGEQYVSAVPIAVDRALLQRGRDRFETFCAACHGILGTGESSVAHNMELRRPASLVSDPVRSFPAGRVYQVISAGYGLMPSYAAELPIHDRWAVVAYLHALQRSQATALASLPAAMRRQAEEQLR